MYSLAIYNRICCPLIDNILNEGQRWGKNSPTMSPMLEAHLELYDKDRPGV